MKLVDTHAHLYAEEFDTDQSEILQRAVEEGIEKIYLPAIDSSTHERMLTLENKFPAICKSMMGLHPCSVKENYQEELATAQTFFEQRKFAAVGEIGLDFYWDRSFDAQQYDAFEKQLTWSAEYRLPVVIHSRESTRECVDVIRKFPAGSLKGIFHCFSGTADLANEIISLGFYLGIGGVVTYKNSGLQELLKQVDLRHIVLETDAPYLSPVPFRGKRNESSYLKYVVAKLAEIYEVSTEEIARITTANAEKIFGSQVYNHI